MKRMSDWLIGRERLELVRSRKRKRRQCGQTSSFTKATITLTKYWNYKPDFKNERLNTRRPKKLC